MTSVSSHPRKPTPSPASTLVVAALATILTTLAAPRPSPAQSPQPAKKDNSARTRPKDAVLTASVSPGEARPGDTVVYTVTAKLKPHWHIYTYAKEQAGAGPRKTRFDLFDSGGLTPVGDWTASREPIRQKEPVFPDLDFVEYYEDEVSWSHSLKVPADAPSGKATIRCQASYQICDAKSCSFPGAWTLPDVAVTVIGGGAASKADAPATPKAGTAAVAKAETKAEPAAAAGETNEAKNPRTVTDVEQKARQGVIPLMIASALGGLLALAMPCVWPMVPITVNFFVKQGQSKRGNASALAVTYCLAIIGVFTAVGVLCSFFVSATALPRLANNPWLNFAVAGLFFAFGLSLLGVFEISLPSALLNASSRGESRGGLVGVVFMALTLTITSFTCTFPVVGGLLVMASAGQFFYPIIGLATFATVLALPFFLLALSPGLLSKVPKSGDWMNAVKVVGGLVEIGAAFKFLNTAEIAFVTPENAWIDAQFVLTSWVVLAAVCAFYLLGFFRTDHDHDAVKVGPGRMILGCAFLGIALFLAPALFGRPPQSQIWDRLVIGILPPDAGSDFRPGGSTMVASGEPREQKASDADPAKAERQEKTFHGVTWGLSYDQAVEQSRAETKPILIDFTGVNCANCRLMEQRVLPRPEVAALLRRFVTVQLYTDFVPIASITADQREDLARKNQERQLDLGSEPTNPLYLVLSPEGKVLGAKGGYVEPGEFVDFLNRSLGKVKGKDEGKVAQTEDGR